MAEERHICALLRQGCGGCPLLETPYPEQLRQKQARVEALLGEFGPVSPILGMEHPWHYRNKAISTFCTGPGRRLDSGIYAAGTHRVVRWPPPAPPPRPGRGGGGGAAGRPALPVRALPGGPGHGACPPCAGAPQPRHRTGAGGPGDRRPCPARGQGLCLQGAGALPAGGDHCAEHQSPPLQRGAGAAGKGALGQGVHRGHPVRGAVPAGGLQLLSDQSGADRGGSTAPPWTGWGWTAPRPWWTPTAAWAPSAWRRRGGPGGC